MEKMYSSNGGFLNGATFEVFVAEQMNGTRYGGIGQPDVVLEDGRKVECKFFTRDYNANTGKYIYNHANGFTVRNRTALLDDLRNYCKGFDLLAVGTGNFKTKDSCDWELMTPAEAFDWLAERILANGKKAIRFAFEAEPARGGSTDKRLATLHRNGFAL